MINTLQAATSHDVIYAFVGGAVLGAVIFGTFVLKIYTEGIKAQTKLYETLTDYVLLLKGKDNEH